MSVTRRVLAVLLAMVLILPNFVTAANAAGKTTVTVMAAEYSQNSSDWWSQFEKKFEQANSQIDLTVEIVNWNDIYTVINTRIANNHMVPDILNIDIFADYVDLLHPVTDYMSQDTYKKFDAAFLEQSKVDGEIWAVPDLTSCRALYYNTNILMEAGAQVPTTWKELEIACAVIAEHYGEEIIPFGLDMSTDEGYATFTLFSMANGGGWLDAAGNWMLNSPENVEAVEFALELYRNGYTNPNPEIETRYDLQDMFAAGKVAMLIAPDSFRSWFGDSIMYGVSGLPANEGKTASTIAVMDRFMCFDNKQTKDEMAAITTFFDFFYEDENYLNWVETEGFLPATTSALELMAQKNPAMGAWNEAMQSFTFYPAEKAEWWDARMGVIDVLQRALLGENVETLLNALQAEITGTDVHVHVAEIIPGVEATCTKAGWTDASICSECKAVLAAHQVIPATGHSYVSKDGKTYTCSVCQEPGTVDAVLEDVVRDAVEAGSEDAIAEAVEKIQQLGAENIKSALEQENTGIQEQITQLEKLIDIDVAIQVDSTVAENFSGAEIVISGAKLNETESQSESVILRVSGYEGNAEPEIPEEYEDEKTVLFSMNLENIQNTEQLQVPVIIQLPIPAGMDQNNLAVLHFKDNGRLSEIIIPQIQGGNISVVVSGFSNFAIVEKREADNTEPDVKRLAGLSKYETSIAIANEMKNVLDVEKFESIVLANSDNFADALAGSYLAAVKQAPIIIGKLKYADIVCDYVNNNLKTNGTVYVLGGEGAMPEAMLSGITVTEDIQRLAGNDRYATNLAILEAAGVAGKDILVATGQDFADSLSASATGLPILLVNGKPGKTLSDAQKEFLAKVEGKIYIIGGESAVPVSMVEQIEVASGKKTERIAGGSRYETSVKIAQEFLGDAESAVVAYASTFPDGLCGGPLAYAVGAPLILTKDGKSEAPAYTEANAITSGYVLGGSGLISDDFAMEIFQTAEISK